MDAAQRTLWVGLGGLALAVALFPVGIGVGYLETPRATRTPGGVHGDSLPLHALLLYGLGFLVAVAAIILVAVGLLLGATRRGSLRRGEIVAAWIVLAPIALVSAASMRVTGPPALVGMALLGAVVGIGSGVLAWRRRAAS